jgi:hypothetical protein
MIERIKLRLFAANYQLAIDARSILAGTVFLTGQSTAPALKNRCGRP